MGKKYDGWCFKYYKFPKSYSPRLCHYNRKMAWEEVLRARLSESEYNDVNFRQRYKERLLKEEGKVVKIKIIEVK